MCIDRCDTVGDTTGPQKFLELILILQDGLHMAHAVSKKRIFDDRRMAFVSNIPLRECSIDGRGGIVRDGYRYARSVLSISIKNQEQRRTAPLVAPDGFITLELYRCNMHDCSLCPANSSFSLMSVIGSSSV
jgi:hypothetical protein